jgi:hypothetical protein
VENAGQQDEHELPVGNDHGYVWRLYSYWRIEEKDGGTYIQVESVGLSRTIPWAIAWLVDPLTRSIPRNVLFRLLDSTRIAVQSKAEPHTHSTLSNKFNLSVVPQRSPETSCPDNLLSPVPVRTQNRARIESAERRAPLSVAGILLSESILSRTPD